jgi:hypothetical protein
MCADAAGKAGDGRGVTLRTREVAHGRSCVTRPGVNDDQVRLPPGGVDDVAGQFGVSRGLGHAAQAEAGVYEEREWLHEA